jgi:hypothetical protein
LQKRGSISLGGKNKMISIDRSSFFFLTLVALLVPTAFAVGQPVSMTWPEAVAQLTGERTKAETCVSLVKKHGNEAQIARGQLAYANAKADADAVIAGLITALSAGQQPASLSSLQAKLSSGVSGLAEFCGAVADLLPSTVGQKGVIEDIAKASILPLLKMLSDGVAHLYGNYRNDDALTRRTIQTQLEAARWPTFSEVKAAQ